MQSIPGNGGVQALGILVHDPATAHLQLLPHEIERDLEAGFSRYPIKAVRVLEISDTLVLAFAAAQATGPTQGGLTAVVTMAGDKRP